MLLHILSRLVACSEIMTQKSDWTQKQSWTSGLLSQGLSLLIFLIWKTCWINWFVGVCLHITLLLPLSESSAASLLFNPHQWVYVIVGLKTLGLQCTYTFQYHVQASLVCSIGGGLPHHAMLSVTTAFHQSYVAGYKSRISQKEQCTTENNNNKKNQIQRNFKPHCLFQPGCC